MGCVAAVPLFLEALATAMLGAGGSVLLPIGWIALVLAGVLVIQPSRTAFLVSTIFGTAATLALLVSIPGFTYVEEPVALAGCLGAWTLFASFGLLVTNRGERARS